MTKLEKKKARRARVRGPSVETLDAIIENTLKKKFDLLNFDYSKVELRFSNLLSWQQGIMKNIKDGAVLKTETGRISSVERSGERGRNRNMLDAGAGAVGDRGDPSGRLRFRELLHADDERLTQAAEGESPSSAYQYVNRLQRGDRHSERASRMFGVPVENVTPEQRAEGKRANFMEVYSGTVTGRYSGHSPTLMILDDALNHA